MENALESIKNGQVSEDVKSVLRDLVNEVFTFNRYYSDYIREYKEKKIKKSHFSFRFPFVLNETDVSGFQKCIRDRLIEKYGDDGYKIRFSSNVEYKNGDEVTYSSIENLFEASHDETMRRIYLNWTYTIDEPVREMIIPIDYDIIILYEIEQKSDQPEKFLLEEFGGILIEGNSTEWNNQTLVELKRKINSTKMQAWWYYPRKISLALREYSNLWIYFAMFSIVIALIIPAIFDREGRAVRAERAKIIEETRISFIENTREMPDPSEKLQALIEFTHIPLDLPPLPTRSTLWTILYWFVALVVTGTLTIAISKASRYFFPKSMILIGNNKVKEKNKLRVYAFIWGTIITLVLAIIVALIFQTK